MKFADILPQGVKDALFEEEPAATPKPQETQPIWIAPQKPTITIPSPPVVSHTFSNGVGTIKVASSAVASILSDLRAKTNFDTTPVGQQLKEATDALADTGLTPEQKSKTAMKLSKQSPTQVVSILQGLQLVLSTEQKKFDATMLAAKSAEVVARQTKSSQLQSDINDAEAKLASLRQDKAQVDSELREKQDKIASAQANYAAASEARNAELAEMISHYQSIPEVK